MPEIEHRLDTTVVRSAEDEAVASLITGAGACGCGARSFVRFQASGVLQGIAVQRAKALIIERHKQHVRESEVLANEHRGGRHNLRARPGCRRCALALHSDGCRCWGDAAEHGAHCELMTVGCCGACVNEDRALQPHEWVGLPGAESRRVECGRCGYLVQGLLPGGVAFCDGGRYLTHAHQLHRDKQSSRCAACGGCWSCATERFTLPLPGVCAGTAECGPEPRCEDCREPLPGGGDVYCGGCLTGYYRQRAVAQSAIDRAS